MTLHLMQKKMFDLKGQTKLSSKKPVNLFLAMPGAIYFLICVLLQAVERYESIRLITLIDSKSKFYKLYLAVSETY